MNLFREFLDMHDRQIWIVDFGSQYTQLITRKTREIGYSSTLMTWDEFKELEGLGQLPKALVLSGGPQSVFEDKEDYTPVFKHTNLPVLGICYGMQLMGQYFQGKVEKGIQGEYGHAQVVSQKALDANKLPDSFNVWMSHSDHVVIPPAQFDVIMKSTNGLVAGIQHQTRPLVGLQFHPEVEHTESGKDILNYFYKDVAQLSTDWSSQEMLDEATLEVQKIGATDVLCAFSGGVDSLVAATLAQKILKDRLYCFFIDNGLLRPQDYDHIELLQKQTPLNIEFVDAKDVFLNNLKGVDDPEEKRKIIGRTFIEVFEQKVHLFEKNKGIHFTHLLQGTLFPDVIESTSPHKKGGKSVTIKSHHNVGGLPQRMKLELLEPLRYLFKDEVRAIGEKLGLPHEWVFRHPFPGPGIGVRVLGELRPEFIEKVQKSDQILFEELKKFKLYEQCWQAFTVFLPVKTVGVKGDSRAYEHVICLRIVNSTDGMTAKWSDFSSEFFNKVSGRITNEVSGITRVVYDITSKPPGTIEWE